MLADGLTFVVPTAWAGETVLRICIVNPLTTSTTSTTSLARDEST